MFAGHNSSSINNRCYGYLMTSLQSALFSIAHTFFP